MAPVATPIKAASGDGLVCALTFDDGPNGKDTAALLDFLGTRGIRAVFAVIGEQIQSPGGAELLRREVAEGHVLCNHSTSFADMGDWDADRVRADMLANLAIIRDALGDPNASVPFWRAPNGSWGVTAEVAVELGMQPLDVLNVIEDWIDQDSDLLALRLHDVMTPGGLVLVHDGGGDRAGSVAAVMRVVDQKLSDGWSFTLPHGAE